MKPVSDASGRRPALLAGSLAFLAIATTTAGKALRDAWFLSTFSVHRMPLIVIATALASIWAAMKIGTLARRLGPRRLLVSVNLVATCSLVAEWALQPVFPQATAALAYVTISVLSALWVSLLWETINEHYPVRHARRVLPWLAVTGTAGGVLGGLSAALTAASTFPEHMLLVVAVFHLTGAALTGLFPDPPKSPSTADVAGVETTPRGVVRDIMSNAWLRRLSVLGMAAAASGGVADYAFKSETASQLSTHASLLTFMGGFHASLSLLTFAVQLGLTTRLLARWPLTWTLATGPILVGCAGVLDAAVHQWWSAVVMCGVESMLSDSLYRSAYELCYAPLPVHLKREAKPVIDVGLERIGTLGGAALVLGVVHGLPSLTWPTLPLMVSGGSMLVLVLSLKVGHDYVTQLRLRLWKERPQSGPRRVGSLPASSQTVPTEQLLNDLSAVDFERRRRAASWLLRRAQREPTVGLALPQIGLALQAELVTLQRLDLGPERDEHFAHVLALISMATDPEAHEALVAALSSGDERLRSAAIEYLGEVSPFRIRRPLLDALQATPPLRPLPVALEDK